MDNIFDEQRENPSKDIPKEKVTEENNPKVLRTDNDKLEILEDEGEILKKLFD